MPATDLQTPELSAGRWQRLGAWVDAWTPRFLKVLGASGIAVSIVLFPFGKFDPLFFGGSLTAASGGYFTDALHALKPGRQ